MKHKTDNPKIAKIRKQDLRDAIDFCDLEDPINFSEIEVMKPKIVLMKPTEFIKDWYRPPQKFGWLKTQSKSWEEWGDLLSEAEGVSPEDEHRDFYRIGKLYNEKKMPPAIQIDGKFCDGMGRAIFYHGIGEKMPVAVYKRNKKDRNHK